LRIDRIETVSELEGLEHEWQALLDAGRPPQLSMSYPFVLASAATHQPASAWSIYLAREDGQLKAAAFGTRSSLAVGNRRIPVFQLGADVVTEILVDPALQQEALSSLIDGIMDREKVPIVEFGRLTEPTFQALLRSLKRSGLRSTWNHAGYGYVWDATIGRERMYQQLGHDRRAAIRRTGRRLFEKFQVEVQHLSSRSVPENLAWFDRFVDLEASGWKGEQRTSIRHRPGSEAYFRLAVAAAARHGMMRWYALVAGGRALAMDMGMQTGRVLWVPKTAYDEQYSRYSPGAELVHQLHLACIADPAIDRVNWISAAPWLDPWKPDRQQYYRLRIYGRGALGRTLYAVSRLRDALRRHVLARGMDLENREHRFQ